MELKMLLIAQQSQRRILRRLLRGLALFRLTIVQRLLFRPIQAPTAEGGAPRTFGGGNDTLGGVEEIIGREVTPFTGVIRKSPQNIIKALKELQCESWADNLGVFLFDENGAIGAIKDTAVATKFYPIPIRAFFIGDKTLGGLEAPDSNAIQWSFLPNWSDDLVIIAPEFNPLTDLKPAG